MSVSAPQFDRPTTGLVNVDPSTAARGSWLCEQLESANILFFSRSPFILTEDDRDFLRSQKQTSAGYHKNIAYRPAEDRLTGIDASRSSEAERLLSILRNYSNQVTDFLTRLLPLYAGRWRRDFASFRSVEERGRPARTRARNDLPHVDAFPTRPTNGARILRIFTNLNPVQNRVWIVSDPFPTLAERFARELGIQRPTHPFISKLQRAVHWPGANRSAYDRFMHRFHNFLKENDKFQADCPKQRIEFPPGSSWMVYTDAVSHAVLEGQFALEQTFLVAREAMVLPDRAPISILEKIAGHPLAGPV